jgi:hypothetical protein
MGVLLVHCGMVVNLWPLTVTKQLCRYLGVIISKDFLLVIAACYYSTPYSCSIRAQYS